MNNIFSIIIPAYNEEKYIDKLLNSLISQKFPMENVEIIVVDNCSEDDTQLIVKQFQQKNPQMDIKLLNENKKSNSTGSGAAISRNAGARKASGKILIFLDADNIVKEDFLSSIYKQIKEEKKLAGTIFLLPIEKSLMSYLVFFILELIKLSRIKPFGKNYVHKELFHKVGGYNEEIALGENLEFLIRVKKYLKATKGEFGHINKPIYASMRRFEKYGYKKILIQWFLGYIGIGNINYSKLSS